jgi:hypothetical protein
MKVHRFEIRDMLSSVSTEVITTASTHSGRDEEPAPRKSLKNIDKPVNSKALVIVKQKFVDAFSTKYCSADPSYLSEFFDDCSAVCADSLDAALAQEINGGVVVDTAFPALLLFVARCIFLSPFDTPEESLKKLIALVQPVCRRRSPLPSQTVAESSM